MVGQGEPRAKSKDKSPKCKKCKVSKEAIVESEAEVEVVEVMAEPEARPCGRAWTRPVEELLGAGEGPEMAQALWAIAADLRAIRRAQEAITCNAEASQRVAEAQVNVSRQMLSDMALMSYDLGALVEGW